MILHIVSFRCLPLIFRFETRSLPPLPERFMAESLEFLPSQSLKFHHGTLRLRRTPEFIELDNIGQREVPLKFISASLRFGILRRVRGRTQLGKPNKKRTMKPDSSKVPAGFC